MLHTFPLPLAWHQSRSTCCALYKHCSACLQVYLKDDIVIREGEVSREMYFIKSGAVQVSHSAPGLLPC